MAESDLLDLAGEREFKVDALHDRLLPAFLVKIGLVMILVVDNDHVQVREHCDLLLVDYRDSFGVFDSQEVAHVNFFELVAGELSLVEHGKLRTGNDCEDHSRSAVVASSDVLLGLSLEDLFVRFYLCAQLEGFLGKVINS